MNYGDPRDGFTLPELSPTAERQHRLTAFADGAIFRARLLYSRDAEPKEVVRTLRITATELRRACMEYGQSGENKPAIADYAEELRASAHRLTALDPKMGSYYVGPIAVAADQILAELKAPLPKAERAA